MYDCSGQDDDADNPFANTGLDRDDNGNPIIPQASQGGIQLNHAQFHQLLDRVIENWDELNTRSGHAFRSTRPMFVCQKYGQDVQFDVQSSVQVEALVRSLASSFNFKNLDSVSFAIAHNVL